VASNAIPGELQLDGPLEAKGMDPTWVLRLRAPDLEADVLLFYGPMVDVSAFRPKHLDDRALVGGEDDVTPERLIEMLNDLAQTAGGGVLASWLRPSP
jgi:hypothetical protein